MARRAAALALVTMLAGCYGPVGVPVGAGADPAAVPRDVRLAADAETATRRAHDVLRELGFEPVADAEGDRWRRRTSGDPRWAFCPPLRIEDDDRYRTVFADGGIVEVALAVEPSDEAGTRVAIDPTFRGVYRDATAFVGTRTRPCRSFGIVETRFVDALAE